MAHDCPVFQAGYYTFLLVTMTTTISACRSGTLSQMRLSRTVMHTAAWEVDCDNHHVCLAGLPGELFATVDKALDERTIGHNPERLCLLKVCLAHLSSQPSWEVQQH